MISQVRWIKEDGRVRNYLAEKFGLPVGNIGTEMVNGVLVSDGRSARQIYDALTVPKLREFTGLKTTDVYELFDAAVEIAKADLGLITKPKKIPKKFYDDKNFSRDVAEAGRNINPSTIDNHEEPVRSEEAHTSRSDAADATADVKATKRTRRSSKKESRGVVASAADTK